MSPNAQNSIEYMDLGSFDAKSIQMAKWISIVVKSQEFVSFNPRGSALLNQTNDIIIFGGQKTQCFYIDIGFLRQIENTSVQGIAHSIF
mgnify:CR=1 FL=1